MNRCDRIFSQGLYRSRHGAILGVCRGIAEYFDFSVFWTRAVMLIVMIFTGFWPMTMLYIIVALIMKPEPVIPFGSEGEHEFYDSYLYSRRSAAQRLKRRYKDLERRIRRMEDTVTGSEFNWENRL